MDNVAVDAGFDELLDYLKQTRGFDLGSYKRTSLVRRVQRRLDAVGAKSFPDYIEFLEVHPGEFSALFNTILINVTGFFRDPPAWEYLADRILPRIVAEKPAGEPIRAWSAGVASGEEAYTIAMLLAEALGKEEAVERAKIYATDVDDEALNKARSATYTQKEVENVPRQLLDAYFERAPDGYMIDKDLRRTVIFGRHDLNQDPPISRIDLLVCRNTLMYFHTEAQADIIKRFHFALSDRGYLFLGRSEMLLTHGNSFVPIDRKQRVFAKVHREDRRERPLAPVGANANNNPGPHSSGVGRMLETAFDTDPVGVARIGIDPEGNLALANARARILFGITPKDIGRPVLDLEVGRRPVDLRPHLDAAFGTRRPVTMAEVEWVGTSGVNSYVDVHITPLLQDGGFIGLSVSFVDVSRARQLREELQTSHQELETAYEELQSTNEELETTNEELQSANEELETTNEELQSANEELETMNEELQSTNQEMETINEQLRERSDELAETNAFLESVLAGLRSGVIVVDADLRVVAWNDKSEDLWGLRAEETRGQHLLKLDIGLPVERLVQPIRQCLTSEDQSEITVEATNRRGRSILCRVICSRLRGAESDVRGVIVLTEEVQRGSAPS